MPTDRSQTSRHSGQTTSVKPLFSAIATHGWLIWLLVPLLLVFMFVTDIWTPIGPALPVSYIAGLLLVVALPGTREKILAAATCTILTIFNYFLSPPMPVGPGRSVLCRPRSALRLHQRRSGGDEGAFPRLFSWQNGPRRHAGIGRHCRSALPARD